MGKPNLELLARLRGLANGQRTSVEIAELAGINPRHARKIMLKYDLPRLSEGARKGKDNHQFETGRRIATSGYALITAPDGYAGIAKDRANRPGGKLVWEHRYVLEQKLGRPLLPSERVDHVDGLTLHNAPENLRAFASNAEHLKETLTGKRPRWTDEGHQNMFLRHRQPEGLQRVDIYRQRRANGEMRLRQILLLALTLGTDSPYLLGTHRHTAKAGIDLSSRSTIEAALRDLYLRWGWAQTP